MEKEETKIKCLVLSGGGVQLLSQLGLLNNLIKSNKLNLSEITHYYGTSAGSILNIPLSLNIDIDIISNYFIKRPWDQLFKIDIFNFVYLFSNCCLIKKELIKKALEPLFTAGNIDMDIDMETLYKINNKELHILTTNITDGKSEDISHLTHPKWKLIDAVHASCCIPILFEPITIMNKCYIDGGILNNFALNHACEIFKKDEICGITIKYTNFENGSADSYSNIFEYLQYLLMNGFKKFVKSIEYDITEYKNIYEIESSDNISIFQIVKCFSEKEYRIQLFESGKIVI